MKILRVVPSPPTYVRKGRPDKKTVTENIYFVTKLLGCFLGADLVLLNVNVILFAHHLYSR